MRLLGVVFLLFGIAATVCHFMAVDTGLLNWVNNWGEGAAWGIRGGAIVLGLLMAAKGKKKQK